MTSPCPGLYGCPFLPPPTRFELFLRWDGPAPETAPFSASPRVACGFDALLTVDRGFAHQQNLDDLPLPVVILLAASNRPDDLRPLVPEVIGVLSGTLQRRVYHISAAAPGG